LYGFMNKTFRVLRNSVILTPISMKSG
jgi:hypothetical protein